MKKPSKARAIRDYCLECGGGSPKEVTLCHLLDCPLWQFRTGGHVTSKAYQRRIERAFKNYPEDLKEIQALGIDLADFRAPEHTVSHSCGKRGQSDLEDTGEGTESDEIHGPGAETDMG